VGRALRVEDPAVRRVPQLLDARAVDDREAVGRVVELRERALAGDLALPEQLEGRAVVVRERPEAAEPREPVAQAVVRDEGDDARRPGRPEGARLPREPGDGVAPGVLALGAPPPALVGQRRQVDDDHRFKAS